MPKKVILKRSELYALVWEHPLIFFTKKYMVSYSSFKKICEQQSIPLPPNGYWSKKKFGKDIKKPELDLTENEEEIILYKGQEGDNRDFGALTEMDQKILEIESDPKTDFKIPARLPGKLDPIIKQTKKWYNNEVKTPENLGYYERYYPGAIRCWVSKIQLKRALIIFSVLVRNLKARGHEMAFGSYHSFVKLYGIEIEIYLQEKNQKVKVQGRYGEEFETNPTGNLYIQTGRYYYSKTWNDAKTIKIEDKISTIIAWLEIEAKAERQREIESKKREQERLKRKQLEKERQELIDQELIILKELYQKSELLYSAQKLRKYLKNFEELIEKENQLTKENIELLDFGYRKADWLDPLTEFKDDLFNDLDPYKLLQAIKN